MANPQILTPVAGDDPCGPDLRWDPEFVALMDGLESALAEDPGAVLDAEVAQSSGVTFEEVADMAARLSARTKDVRVLVAHAEASWRDGGLAAFAQAMEDAAVVLETWPGPRDGVHPRAEEDDGDLGERTAALGRLLSRVPEIAATVGWGADVQERRKAEASATLRGVFGRWKERLGLAFGDGLPSVSDAWRSLRGLLGPEASADHPGEADPATSGEEGPKEAPALDAWDLIDGALARMTRQDRHSPARPVLELLAGWRSLGILEIADAMKASGISLEQLLESVKQQIRPPA